MSDDTLWEKATEAAEKAIANAWSTGPYTDHALAKAVTDAVLSVVEPHVRTRLVESAACFTEGHRMEIARLTRERDDFRFHPLSECEDQTTCPVHPCPARTSQPGDRVRITEEHWSIPTEVIGRTGVLLEVNTHDVEGLCYLVSTDGTGDEWWVPAVELEER